MAPVDGLRVKPAGKLPAVMDHPYGATPPLAASLAEREYLQQSIGRTGLLALRPLQVTGLRDRWHRHVLQS